MPSAPTEIIIRPVAGFEHVDPRKVWEYRHLVRSLVWRDVRMKFDAMHLGFLWSTARPLLIVLVISQIRGLGTASHAMGLPFPLFLYLGLTCWFFFIEGLTESSSAVQRDAGVISKVFFPRIISPLVAVTANLVDLLVSLVPVVGFMWYYDLRPGWTLALLPLVVLALAVMALGAGLIFSRLIVVVRDFERVLQLVAYVGFFASPIFHSMEDIPPDLRGLAQLNPASGVLLAARGCFIADGSLFPWTPFLVSCGTGVMLLVIGVILFRNMQDRLLERL
jgi:lipopolysaccharide transport system permease protein